MLAMYPDLYQRRSLLKLPYWFSAGIMGLVAFQCFMPQDARMLMRTPTSHSIECTMFIARGGGTALSADLRSAEKARRWCRGMQVRLPS